MANIAAICESRLMVASIFDFGAIAVCGRIDFTFACQNWPKTSSKPAFLGRTYCLRENHTSNQVGLL
jgi:hypothetical protein